MAGPLLTTSSKIQCPHGGRAFLTTSNRTTSAGARILLESDVHQVVGCPFTVGSKYQPCVTIAWSAGASAVSIGGEKALVKSSIGKCKNAEGAVQGVAIVGQTQQRASAR